MTSLLDVSTWRTQLGYLPVPMFGEANERRHVLLNGGHGNFCLDLSGAVGSARQLSSYAWSCNVDHYVRIDGKQVEVIRWDIRDREVYAVQDVARDLPGFQQHLGSNSAPKERSVVAHAIATYRRLRSCFQGSGEDALLAYLGLLNSAWAQQRNIDLAQVWSDADEAWGLLGTISRTGQSALLRDIAVPSADDNDPLFDLVLRHAAGRIFQEAHYLVDVSPQLDFDGLSTTTPIGPVTRSSGAYFTPTPLVRTVVEQSLKHVDLQKPSLRLLDPACGSAEFLREALRQLEQQQYQGTVEVIGYDISLAACRMARFALAIESLRWPGRLKVSIEQRDSLDGAPWPSDVSCCLMNPPYVAWSRMGEPWRRKLAQVLGPLYRRRPDVSSAFALLASASLAPDGVLGAVMPASLLDGKSSAPIRESMEHQLTLALVARLGSQRVFSEATVDPALVIAKHRPNAATRRTGSDTVMVWADHRTDSSEKALRALRCLGPKSTASFDPVVEDGFSIYVAPVSHQASTNWAPRAHESFTLHQHLAALPRVTNFFKVCQGVLTGLNSAFILNHREHSSLPEDERAYFRPAIMGDSIGRGVVSTSSWVFYPYDESGLTLKTETDLRSAVPRYFEQWLEPHKEALLARARISKDRWWKLSESRPSWQPDKSPRFMSAYFGRAGSFAFDPTGEYAVVQGYAWVPHITLNFDASIGFAMNALLAAPFTDQLLAAVSNNLAGGQWNLSSRFMARMPFPDLWSQETGPVVTALADLGEEIWMGRSVAPAELDRWARIAYGFHQAEAHSVAFPREASALHQVEVIPRLTAVDEELEVLRKCPESVRSHQATRVVALQVRIPKQRDAEALTDLLLETRPTSIDISFAIAEQAPMARSFTACIGIFASGETRTIGQITRTASGKTMLTPYDYCALLDPGDETQSPDCQTEMSLLLHVVGIALTE